MTAINVFRQYARLSIISDAAAYDREGYVLAMASKCFPIPHLRAAIATRGTCLVTALYAAQFGCRFQTFDEMVSRGSTFAEEVYDLNFAGIAASGEPEIDMVVCGFSESRGRPEVYMLSSTDRHGFEPWTLVEVADPVLAMPEPTAEHIDTMPFPSDAERIEPVKYGIHLLEGQRALKLPIAVDSDDASYHLVGGFALLTTITLDGVTQRIVHRWDEDEVGKRIEPQNRDLLAEPPAFANRQQRRAWDREQQKLRREGRTHA